MRLREVPCRMRVSNFCRVNDETDPPAPDQRVTSARDHGITLVGPPPAGNQ